MNIVYIADVADFHALDKVAQTASVLKSKDKISVFSGFSIECFNLKESSLKELDFLFRIDLSQLSNRFHSQLFRNFLKALCYPLNYIALLCFNVRHRGEIYHAFTMYYIFLMSLTRNNYYATPQASEVLLRMQNSKIYCFFASFALKRAKVVLVDSHAMYSALKKYSISSVIHKNGFNIASITRIRNDLSEIKREKILSIRGISDIYQIHKILESRNHSLPEQSIDFIYPSLDYKYLEDNKGSFIPSDRLLGKLDKLQLYETMSRTLLAISIPKSDSSPRSVYEAVFCGSIVLVSQAEYINELPKCMQSRILLADLCDPCWLESAIEQAKQLSKKPYFPSDEALQMFDQDVLARRLLTDIYS